ncbi:BolA family protein [Bauldia sp.]|uniref:BolA family protein n=1 Tax=Bauldia sp. TaxID=2575872 RepID=UPI003BA9CD6D
MTGEDRIAQTLTEAFDPVSVNVVDESDRHKGHAGARPEGETHFRVVVVSEAFRGKSRLAAHRMVHAALRDEFARGLHALVIDARAPDA